MGISWRSFVLVDVLSSYPVRQAATRNVARYRQDGCDDQGPQGIDPPDDVYLVDDIHNDCGDEEFADIFPRVLKELGAVTVPRGEEVPAEWGLACAGVFQSCAKSEECGNERLNDESEAHWAGDAADEVLPVLEEEVTH
jgi:hypothetical protein